MYRLHFIKTHLKNHKGVVCLYCLLYIFLILFSVAYFYMGFVEGAYYKYFDTMDIIHIVACILAAFLMIFLNREIFERHKYPYVTLYAYNWSRLDNLLAHLISLIFPTILFGTITGLYWNTELEAMCYEGMLIGQLIQHLVLLFFLSSMGFFLGVLLRKYSIALLIVLAFIVIMQYMGLPQVISNMITLDYGTQWFLGSGVTLCIGVALNELGVLMVDRRGGLK